MHTQTTSRAPHTSTIMAATLQGEATKPANCFKLNGSGVVEEGITVELDHPRVGGKPALFVGDYFVLRNERCGVAFDRNGKVRRAIIEHLARDGKKPLELLTQPAKTNPPLLLHVDTNLPANVKIRRPFWNGVIHDGKVLARGFDLREQLLSFDRDGASSLVYYGDGRVVRVTRIKEKLQSVDLTIEEQADLRIVHALAGIEEARSLTSNDSQAQRMDLCYQQLVRVMQFGGARSDSVFERVYDFFEHEAKSGHLPKHVRWQVNDILVASRPAHAIRFNRIYDVPVPVRQDPRTPTNITPKKSSGVVVGDKPKGPPADRRAKMAARAQRDAEIRLAMQNPGKKS